MSNIVKLRLSAEVMSSPAANRSSTWSRTASTSIDYDPRTDLFRRFFSVIQNKMHWAAHGRTAAEVIAERADASKPQMGLTSWTGARPVKSDVGVAKNYLSEPELDTLNRIVSFYLDFAELQALNRKPMYMRDWIGKLDDFLRLSERDILNHAGAVSQEAALVKAHDEYEKFRMMEDTKPSLVESHFRETVEALTRIERESPKDSKNAHSNRPGRGSKRKRQGKDDA